MVFTESCDCDDLPPDHHHRPLSDHTKRTGWPWAQSLIHELVALVAAQAPDADPLVSFMLFIPVLKFLILFIFDLESVKWGLME